jgi:hypothetical protein
MGLEDLSLLINVVTLYKTVDSTYFTNTSSNGNLLLQLIEQRDGTSSTFSSSVTTFFSDLFANFILTDTSMNSLDDMKLKLYLINNITMLIKTFFINNIYVFTEQEMQDFYSVSHSLLTNITYLTNAIELNNQDFTDNEYTSLNTLQTNLHDYIMNTFISKYISSLNVNDENIVEYIENKVTTITSHKIINEENLSKLNKKEFELYFHKKKSEFFDYVDYNSLFFEYLQNEIPSKTIHLYFYKGIPFLRQIDSPLYSHNMLVREGSGIGKFITNQPEEIFHIKYNSNGLRMKDVHNIMIYAYSMNSNNSKRILVGFAFRDDCHYTKIYKDYIDLYQK